MKMNWMAIGAFFFSLVLVGALQAGQNDWSGRRVAFLGDSITDAQHIGCASNYWEFLARDLKLVPLVYGTNGHQWKHVYVQATKLLAEHPDDVDDIVVFAGTNDYNANVPLGSWTSGEDTFRGRVAEVMNFLTERYPGKTIWLLTPLHRGYATFGGTNVQPDESHANTEGLWIDDYVEVVKEAAAKWSAARLIDLNSESGLYPLFDSHVRYFHDANTDRLHPNTEGHERLAKVVERRFRSSDATGLIQKHLAALPSDGGIIRVARDTYHFYEDDARVIWLNPSNNKSGEKRVVIPLEGRRNVTIDGCGSTFVFHGRTFPFAAMNCSGVTFKNFTVTTRFPSCAAFTVLAKTDADFSIEFDEGVCPCEVKNANVTFMFDGHEISTADGRLSLHSLDRSAIHYLVSPDSPGDRDAFPSTFVSARPVDCENRVMRFAYSGESHSKSVKLPYDVGERVVVNLEETRDRDVFFFEDCNDVTLDNIAIRRFGGMGVIAQRSGNVHVNRLRVEPPDGERVTLTADIVQFVGCYGDCSIRNCSGGKSLDDWVNIHGNYLGVVSVAGRAVDLQTQHPSHEGFFPYRVGDIVEFVTSHDREVVASARVASVVPGADRTRCRITVDADLPETVVSGLLVENVTLNPNVMIEKNHFQDFPNVRLSGRGKYLVSGNIFERGNTAILGMDLADYWFESGRIIDMTVKNNIIRNCGGFSFGLSGWSSSDAPKVHGRICLERNVFELVRGEKWTAIGVADFVVRED